MACKITGDIVAHDSAIVIDQPDVDLVARYFRYLIKQWCSIDPRPVLGSQVTQVP